MRTFPHLSLSREDDCALINQRCPVQFEEAARVVWALSNPKDALNSYAQNLDFQDGCRGQFRKALRNILTDMATYVDALQELGFRLLPIFDRGLFIPRKHKGGHFYDINALRRISVSLIGTNGYIEKNAFDSLLKMPFEVDISEYLHLSNYDKINDMKGWRKSVNRTLKESITNAQAEIGSTSGEK